MLEPEQLYAVKLLDGYSEIESGRDVFQEFRQEVFLMHSLSNPYVVKLIGILRSPHLGMVMEVVGGGDLYSQLNDPFNESVFSIFAKRVIDVVSLYQFEKIVSFRNLFALRNSLTSEERDFFREKCQQAAAKSRFEEDVFEEIQRFYQTGSRTELAPFENRDFDYYGISRARFEELLPSLPSLESIVARRNVTFSKVCDVAENLVLTSQKIPELEPHINRAIGEYFSCLSIVRASGEAVRSPQSELRETTRCIEELSRRLADLVVPVEFKLRLKLASDVATGMAYLHQLVPPMIHRDLKSPNIFLTRSLIGFPVEDDALFSAPLAKVGDFGLSVRLCGAEKLQINHQVESDDILALINPTWVAPEITSGAPYSLSADVYSMGIFLWELLTRRHPFLEIELEVLKGHVLSGHRPFISDDLRKKSENAEYVALMEECWSADPGRRPTMKQVKERLFGIAHQYGLPLSRPEPLMLAQCHPLPSAAQMTSFSLLSPEGEDESHNNHRSLTRISSMVLLDSLRDVVWLGFEGGYVARCEFYSDGQFSRNDCMPSEAHQMRVNAMITASSSEGIAHEDNELPKVVWTGGEDGSLNVWAADLAKLDDVLEYNRFSLTQVQYDGQGFGLRFLPFALLKKSNYWIECEHGVLSWFAARDSLIPVGSLDLLNQATTVEWVLGKTPRVRISWQTRPPETKVLQLFSEEDNASRMYEIFRVLNNLAALKHWKKDANGGVVCRLAGRHLHSTAAVLSLISFDGNTWCASGDLIFSEWTLGSHRHTHGLHAKLALEPRRKLSLWQDFVSEPWTSSKRSSFQDIDPRFSLSPSYSASLSASSSSAPLDSSDVREAESNRSAKNVEHIGGIIRVSSGCIWVAFGNGWIVVAVETTRVALIQKHMLPDKLKSIVALCEVKPPDTCRSREVWTVHRDGGVMMWGGVPQEDGASSRELLFPRLLQELPVIPSLASHGRFYCLVQANEQQVWFGTARGHILACDIASKTVTPVFEHTTDASQRRSLNGLASSFCAEVSANAGRFWNVWSASHDGVLRLFTWGISSP